MLIREGRCWYSEGAVDIAVVIQALIAKERGALKLGLCGAVQGADAGTGRFP